MGTKCLTGRTLMMCWCHSLSGQKKADTTDPQQTPRAGTAASSIHKWWWWARAAAGRTGGRKRGFATICDGGQKRCSVKLPQMFQHWGEETRTDSTVRVQHDEAGYEMHNIAMTARAAQ